ncbi:MAG TPA: PAS domain-containing protein [Leptolyngbyaceae cyanobacterium M65_K2018_010]|nr:PAS domain-containing protein [Leptolyngbyaceae cyanobacterium M65_K2018_010]
MKLKVSLRNLLILPFFLQIIGLTGMVGYLSYRSGERAVEALAVQLMAETSLRVQESLTSFLQVPQIVTRINGKLFQSGQFSLQDLAPLEPYLIQQLQLFPELTGIAVANEAGAFLNVAKLKGEAMSIRRRNVDAIDGVLYRYQAQAPDQDVTLMEQAAYPFDPHRDPPQDPWYGATRKAPGGMWRLVVSLEQGANSPQLVMVRFVPIYNASGQFEGVFSAGILLTQLGGFLQSLTPGQNGQIFLVEPSGHLIATSTGEIPFRWQGSGHHADNGALGNRRLPLAESRNELTRAVAQHLLTGSGDLISLPSQPFSELRLQGQLHYVQVTPLAQDVDWLVVTVVPAADFMADIQANLARTALLCALALLGSIGLGLWTAEYITQPILSLKRATQAMTEGLAQIPPTQPTKIQEIETLRQGFDHMVGQLVSSFRALRDRENTLATFLKGVPVGISIHAATGQMLFLNDRGRALLAPADAPESLVHQGLSNSEQLYLAGTHQHYPADRLPVVRGLRGEAASIDDIEIDLGGRRIPLEVHTIPVLDRVGQVRYAINAFQDISLRRQAEQLRANYERELEQRVAAQTASLAQGEVTRQALINAIPDLLMRLGREGMPLEIYNLDAVHWLGDKAEVYQKTMYENLPAEIAAERQHCVETALTTGQIQRHEYEISVDGQTYYEEARIVPVSQDEVLVVVRDISERHEIDRLKDEFVAIVSHELRTPLTAIRGALGILDSGVLSDRPEKAQNLLKMSLQNTERLIRLVNDILDLERLASGKVKLVKEPCQVAELMQWAINGVEALALEAAVILYSIPLDVTVWAAPDAIVQALTNLLSNAIKFSAAGGKVWLRAEVVSAESPSPFAPGDADLSPLPLTPAPTDPVILFAVTDEGRGIPADRLAAIFERFQQVDGSDSRQKGGTGLGLAICKNIVEQHGGTIGVKSVVGRGSTFYFTLPLEAHS